jgi:hypothetical protein
MSGNARGKLKEHFEGMHRCFDWTIHHCNQSLTLIGDTHPDLSGAIESLGEQIKTLDELVQEIYSTI